MTLNKNPTAAHHHIASLIWTIHRMILEISQNRSLKGTSTLLIAAGQQEKRLKMQLEQLLRSGIYQLFLLLSAT